MSEMSFYLNSFNILANFVAREHRMFVIWQVNFYNSAERLHLPMALVIQVPIAAM